MNGSKSLILSAAVLFSTVSIAQKAPKYDWLAGSWEGGGFFGGRLEEVWSQPDENGVMMGMYRHYNSDGSFNFYEFLILDEEGLHLKHFNADLEGWE